MGLSLCPAQGRKGEYYGGRGGEGFILSLLSQIIRLDENDTKTKLETLFKKNLYPTAINLARSQAYNDGLIEIFTQYGDHLYR